MNNQPRTHTSFRKPCFRLIVCGLIVVTSVFAVAAQKKPSTPPADKTPVILIHGIGGSDLEVVARGLLHNGFPNDVLRGFLGDPQNLQFDENGEPRTDTISKEIGATSFYDVPGSKDITDLSKLLQTKGYTKDLNLFEFFYDFRYSVPQSARLLDQFIENAKVNGKSEKIDIVAHSMGGLIARQYLIDRTDGEKSIRRLIFVATPHLGAPKALKALRYGDNLGVAIVDKCKLKRAVHNLPGMFNLLPGNRYFEVNGGGYFNDATDVDADGVRGVLNFDQTVANLKNGKESRCPLKPSIDSKPFDRLSDVITDRHLIQFRATQDPWQKPEAVMVFSIVGYGNPTLTAISDESEGIKYTYSTGGDATVPIASADAINADKVFYVDLKKLKAEHSTMIGSNRIGILIFDLLNAGATTTTEGIALSRPNTRTFVTTTRVER